jgi:hypothetical protein
VGGFQPSSLIPAIGVHPFQQHSGLHMVRARQAALALSSADDAGASGSRGTAIPIPDLHVQSSWPIGFVSELQNLTSRVIAKPFIKAALRGDFASPAGSICFCLPPGNQQRDLCITKASPETDFVIDTNASNDSFSFRSRPATAVAALVPESSWELLETLNTFGHVIRFLRSTVEFNSFAYFLSRFRDLLSQFRAVPIAFVYSAWIDYVARAVRQTHVVDSDGMNWMAINWFTDERFAFISSSLILANQDAVYRRATQDAANAREKGRSNSRQQQHSEADAGYQRGKNGGRRGGGGRPDDRDDDRQRGDRRQHQDSRGGGSRDGRRGDRTDGPSSDVSPALPGTGVNGTGSGGAASSGSGATSSDKRKPMYCKWGPSCTRLADGSCSYKH